MIAKCANPACSAPFRSLREGRVFVKEIEADPPAVGGERSRQPQYFWLCNLCCRTLTVVVEKGKGVRVVPLPASVTAAWAGS